MMHRFIVLTAIIGLVGGLIGAWAAVQLSGEAGAAPPPPGDQKVREQNLDASGFIRVHEQGTANVTGTVNVGNLPFDARGNLRVASGFTKAAELFTGTVNPGETVTTPFTDVQGCRDFTIFVLNAGDSSAGIENAELTLSLDGQHSYGRGARMAFFGDFDGTQRNNSWSFSASAELAGSGTPPVALVPFAGARIQAPTGVWASRTITVTLYCSG
jgi:hypothetical protein